MVGQKGCAPVLFVASGAALWGVIGLFTRPLLSDGLSSMQVTEIRCIITAVAMLLFMAFYDRSMMKIDPRDLWMFLGTGILSIVFFNICYFSTMEILSLSLSAVLLYTAPCFVLVMSVILFKEALTKQKMLALLFAFIGCVFTTGVLGSSETISANGLLFGIGAGFGYALYSIFSHYALEKYHPFTVTFYTFLIASVALLPFCNVLDIVSAGSEPSILGYMLLLGIVSTLLPYFLYTEGLNGMDPGQASVIAFVEPMVATLVGFLAFGENVTTSGAIGIVLILISVTLLNIRFGGKKTTD